MEFKDCATSTKSTPISKTVEEDEEDEYQHPACGTLDGIAGWVSFFTKMGMPEIELTD